MRSRSKVGLFIGGLLLFWAWMFLWPVYGFLSHSKGWPHLPFGWSELPTQTPMQQQISEDKYAALGEQALTLLAKHRLTIHAPALTAAVAIDGTTVWKGAVGWADIAEQIPATIQTQFRIGSSSKALNATALGKLIQADLIDLDQPLSSLLPSVKNKQWLQLTVRQLASHMAGLPHYKETEDIEGLLHFVRMQQHYSDVEQAITLFDDTPLLFDPGTDFYYSSLGTVLLSALMQKAAGMPYQDWVNQQVLLPLEMTQTAPDTESQHSAVPYWRDKKSDSKLVRPWRQIDLSHRLAGGGYMSTSADLVKLGSAYFDGQFLHPETLTSLWQPQILDNGETNPQNYAIGWRQGKLSMSDKTLTTYHHGGVSRGGQSWLVVLPEYQMVVAINTNINTDKFGDFAGIYRDIVRLFISQ